MALHAPTSPESGPGSVKVKGGRGAGSGRHAGAGGEPVTATSGSPRVRSVLPRRQRRVARDLRVPSHVHERCPRRLRELVERLLVVLHGQHEPARKVHRREGPERMVHAVQGRALVRRRDVQGEQRVLLLPAETPRLVGHPAPSVES